jgi:hypothetical protein
MKFQKRCLLLKSVILCLTLGILTGCQTDNLTHTYTRIPSTKTQQTPTPISTYTPTLIIRSSPTRSRIPTAIFSPTPTTNIIPYRTSSPEVTLTHLPTFTPTLPYISYYHSLTPGLYVIRDLGGDYEVVSWNGSYKDKWLAGMALGSTNFTADGNRIAFKNKGIYIYDLPSGSMMKLSELDCVYISWSPDGFKIVASGCDVPDFPHSVAYIVSMNGNKTIQLPVDMGNFSRATWSPNGKWIAYGNYGTYNRGHEQKIYPGDGIYWTEVDCLLSQSDCASKTYGPLVPSALYGSMDFSLTWSPDSRYLAAANYYEDSIHIIDTQNYSERTLIEPSSFGDLFGIAWSPDGDWLAVGRITDEARGTYLLSPWGEESKWLAKDSGYSTGFVIGWISIQWPFIAGNTYTITPAGHGLNIHASPSLSTDVLRKLQPDDTVTILEGPVEADGYTWWKMMTSDGLEGWAVEVSVWYEPVGTATPTPTKSP